MKEIIEIILILVELIIIAVMIYKDRKELYPAIFILPMILIIAIAVSAIARGL